MVGFISFNAFLPSKPAPRPMSASGVASTEILLMVLLMITGNSIRQADTIMPSAIPIIMGLVRMPLMDAFKDSLSRPCDFGPVKDSTRTAATLYNGTVPMIISGAIPELP